MAVNRHVSEHIWCLDVVCLIAVTRRHEDAMKVLKDAQGIVSVINHTCNDMLRAGTC